jgi:hypothetical protein
MAMSGQTHCPYNILKVSSQMKQLRQLGRLGRLGRLLLLLLEQIGWLHFQKN